VNCSETQNQCHPYLDKQLNAATSQEVDAHLQACPCCQKAYEAQRAFLSVLKKLTQNCGFAAPEQLRGRITQSLAAGHEQLEFKPLPRPVKLPRMGWLIGLAASIMVGFGVILAAQMACINGRCPIAMAAEQEHERIINGGHSFWAKDSDPQRLNAAIREHLPELHATEFPNIPNLAKYELTPTQCGRIVLANLPEGVFVQYAAAGGGDPLTLMMVQTPNSSQAPEVEHKSAKYHMSISERHTVCSWHCQKSGLLYVLVTRRHDSLEIAEVASN